MKKTAFFHAVVLVALLSVSWILLILRYRETSDQPSTSHHPDARETERADVESQPPGPETPHLDKPFGTIEHADATPPAWSEWIAFLTQQTSPADMRAALQAMRETVFSMQRGEASARLRELIGSGVNIRTGLRFQVGRDGSLLGAPDLRTLLIDWLGQVDPETAANVARSLLVRSAEALGPDAYVMHLRNYTRGTTDLPANRNRFVRNYFEKLLENPDWTSHPVPSVAEAMDFAVFLGDGGLVERLSEFIDPQGSTGLTHASTMAIERLVVLDPVGSATAMLDSIEQSSMPPGARAGNFARLNPENPRELNLLTEYLANPSVSRQEAVAFIQSFPNLNMTFSPNLVSAQIPITALGNHMERLKSALDAVENWQASRIRPGLEAVLEEAEQRLSSQIRGEPLP